MSLNLSCIKQIGSREVPLLDNVTNPMVSLQLTSSETTGDRFAGNNSRAVAQLLAAGAPVDSRDVLGAGDRESNHRAGWGSPLALG